MTTTPFGNGQDIPLLATKLYIPPARPSGVSRPHLVQRLDEGLRPGCKLTLVSASAGYGKTTLLSQWAAQYPSSDRRCRVAWFSLDDADNDPVCFWRYAIAALQTVAAGVGGQARDLLRAPLRQPLQSILTVLINDIATLPQQDDPAQTVLVLDDYHAIDTQAIHDSVAFLIERLPPHVHLVIATRVDPPLPLSRWRARAQMVEVRIDDLRFTSRETATFLNQSMGLALTAGDVAALAARTEGWIVGLQMAALSLQGQAAERMSRFVQDFSGSHHYVLDYLTDEVLACQPGPIRSFLLQTSILDRLTAPLCDALLPDLEHSAPGMPTATQNTQSLLEHLDSANLFIHPLDSERRWYRYHRLFADLLRARLGQLFGPEAIASLHARAARWYESQGLLADVMSHALAAGEFEWAARLVEQATIAMLTRGELVTLLSWLEALPEDLVQNRPNLCLIKAWSLTFAGQLDGVEPLLQLAERSIAPSVAAASPGALAPEARELLGNIAAIRALSADMRGEASHAVELAHQADQLLPESDLKRSIIPFILGRAYRAEGDLARAAQAYTQIARIGRETGNVWTLSVALCELASLRKVQGQLRQAHKLYQQALQAADRGGGQQFGTIASVDVGLADLLCEWNDLDTAHRLVADSLEQMQGWENPSDLALAHLVQARVFHARGDIEAASAELEKAGQAGQQRRLFPQLETILDTYRVKLWVAEGDLAAAGRWAGERETAPGADSSPLSRELELLAVSRVRLAQQDPGAALLLLADLKAAAGAGGRHGRLIEMLVLETLAFQSQGDITHALPALEKALALARPEGYVRIFLNEGPPMARLLLQAARHGVESDYVNQLLTALRHVTAEPPHASIDQQAQPLVEPLSPRELEVLHLVAEGLSNREIAANLVISVRTVKKHVQNIHGKLGVQRRTQAVARARELDLL